MDCLLALDHGTTSCRTIIFNTEGTILTSAQAELPLSFPKSGWVEQSPEQMFKAQLQTLKDALSFAEARSLNIQAAGITNQRETTIIWNRKTSVPIYPAIVWQDRRTATLCQSLKDQGLEPLVNQKTGLLLDPYFSATKIQWILNNVAGAKELAAKGELAFGTVDSWLIWKLTNGQEHVTDITNASRTLLFNIHTKQWDEELLSIFNIPPSLLPKVVSSAEECGKISLEKSKPSIPITGIAGDQQASLIGHGCFQKGLMKCTYGTGAFVLCNIENEVILSKQKLLTTIAYQIKGVTHYALEGSVFNCGSVINWVRDTLHLVNNPKEIDTLAEGASTSKDVVFVSALTGLGAPYWNAKAQGVILGLNRGTLPSEIARAALESIALQIHELTECIAKDTSVSFKELRADGGVAKSDLLMQIQANLLEVPVKRASISEVTAWGSAVLAGIGVGLWKDIHSLPSFQSHYNAVFTPVQAEDKELLLQKWKDATSLALKWKGRYETL